MENLVLGIDIGGTNTKLGLIDPYGKIIAKSSFSTRSFARSQSGLIDALLDHSQELTRGVRVKGVGIGLPGIVNFKSGFVSVLVNIPGWKNVYLKKILEKKFRLPVLIDNDVNLMTLGEWKFGAGRGMSDLFCMTLGTGVGGGLIIHNQLYRGAGFAAGEIGHMPINENGPRCNCGGWGCLERYVGNTYLLEEAEKIFKKKKIQLEEVTLLASRGNRKAVLFWKKVAVHIGNGLTGVVNLLNPQCIIIGGGIANAHKYLFETIRETIAQRAMKVPSETVKIVQAKLGVDAGMIGAQVLIESSLGGKNLE